MASNIFGTGFSFDIDIRLGAGAFVCGEETALIASIEGQRGMPRPRPPFPAQKGLWGKPTLINNVETYANVPHIILHGRRRVPRHRHGRRSPGTKVFALAGNVINTGLVEVPMGTTLRDIVYEHRRRHPERAARSRRCKPAVLPAAASPANIWISRWTTSR